MFIKKTTKRVKGKTYDNYLLVQSVATPKGPRHKVVCSLGSLCPGPPEQWRALARRMEAALSGQQELFADPDIDQIIGNTRAKSDILPARQAERLSCSRQSLNGKTEKSSDLVSVYIDGIDTEKIREAGPVHVGHWMWKKLKLDAILKKAGLSDRSRLFSEVMVMNRLVSPSSEHKMPDWIRRSALADILDTDFDTLTHHSLYRNLDKLHPCREEIEKELAEVERSLFNLEDSVYLYDLTSTYFEGQCLSNPQAQRGYSRDKRPDCKQVVVGLVLGKEGFPKAHEIFEGNRRDSKSVEEMLDALERRVGKQEGKTIVVDRGMGFDENLEQIRSRGYQYIVATRQAERNDYLDDFEDPSGWKEMLRKPSPRNPFQKKSKVFIKKKAVGHELYVLCKSEGREEKDRSIRLKQEKRFLEDIRKLKERINKGRLVKVKKIHEAIGRIKERYPRVQRYYSIDYNEAEKSLECIEDKDKKDIAEELDGSYTLKTDRTDLTDEEIWRTYVLLTRVESAFRSMKSPLMERPIFHHLKHRVQTHIFLCVLAYHLLVAIENRFLAHRIHTSWGTLREVLSTHAVVTVILPTADGRQLRIRKGSTPEEDHKRIYKILQIPEEVMKPKKIWSK